MNGKLILDKKEVVIVFAIIVFLLINLGAGSHKSNVHKKNIVCKSNLQNYGRIGNMYTADNDGSLPFPWSSIYGSIQFPGKSSRFCRWHDANFDLTKHPEYAGALWPYIEEREVNLCPAFEVLARTYGDIHPGHDPSIPIVPQFGYSMNAFLGSDGGLIDSRPYHVEKISNVVGPATVFFFAEENMWLNQYAGNVLNDNALISRWNNDVPDPTSFLDAFATFHKAKDAEMNKGVSNAVMADGHVEQVDVRDTHKLAWPF